MYNYTILVYRFEKPPYETKGGKRLGTKKPRRLVPED